MSEREWYPVKRIDPVQAVIMQQKAREFVKVKGGFIAAFEGKVTGVDVDAVVAVTFSSLRNAAECIRFMDAGEYATLNRYDGDKPFVGSVGVHFHMSRLKD